MMTMRLIRWLPLRVGVFAKREGERRENHHAMGKPAGMRWTRENRRKGRQIEREVLRDT